MGRRSGGMTGRIERNIHSGRRLFLIIARTTRMRFKYFFCSIGGAVTSSASRFFSSFSRSTAARIARSVSAPMPASNTSAYLSDKRWYSTSESTRSGRRPRRSSLAFSFAAFSFLTPPADGRLGFHFKLALNLLKRILALVLMHLGHDVTGKIGDLLQVADGHVKDEPDLRGNAAQEPDVGDGRGELDVPHPLAADDRAGDLHAALVADNALVADAAVFPAVAFVVLRGPENALVEEALPLGFRGSVVDGLGLGHLAVGPGQYLVRRREAERDGFKIADARFGRDLRLGGGFPRRRIRCRHEGSHSGVRRAAGCAPPGGGAGGRQERPPPHPLARPRPPRPAARRASRGL